MSDTVVTFEVKLQPDGEARVSDAEMADRLGYSDIYAFRRLIREHEENLKEINQLFWEPKSAAQGGGRRGRAFWLTEAQALFMVSRSDMPAATKIMILVSQAFVAYRRQARDEPKLLVRAFFLADEARRWEKAYPDRFFVELHRVSGWKRPAGNNHSNCAHFINRYVYGHLLGQLGMEVLRDANPANDEGARAHRHHSLLKAEHMPILRSHIQRVEVMLVNSMSLSHFDDAFNRTFPKPDTQIGFLLQEAL